MVRPTLKRTKQSRVEKPLSDSVAFRDTNTTLDRILISPAPSNDHNIGTDARET